ncbi:MAG: deoxyribodipyrimidine photo-lyase [Flammeovirgaceae bacterium]|jgi:deoxyribodipyrimidine photo-lyase|nr:deoxyribodipyrimidine photo-lyase [Flammeovirgaceae bacterium]|tara:strand:- start:26055 stop:27341 length:1287 start_codon:yes stop_codon:yes gene_type:complete
MGLSIFWFRRDLRLEDNAGLMAALQSGNQVVPLFIFDQTILSKLEVMDPRLNFIHEQLKKLNLQLAPYESSLQCEIGEPLDIWLNLIAQLNISAVYANQDYEPYAMDRDKNIKALLSEHGIPFITTKDQVIFEGKDILKADGTPYTVFTPYKNQWLAHFNPSLVQVGTPHFKIFCKQKKPLPSLNQIGFQESSIKVRPYDLSEIDDYASNRDVPSSDGTSYLSPHLRFGTVGVRQLIAKLKPKDSIFLSELIWREFFMQILYHFPQVVTSNFKRKYDGITWRNDEAEFEKWCQGKTGYPMVDAGMRQLNETGYMHNRVRMVTASFLCKHLLIDWRWGETYFAQKLLDFELSSNNGNWQWSAGTGCDAAPYFRVFNPTSQQEKFDPKGEYIKKWLPELNSFDYPTPMVDHQQARVRALSVYKKGLEAYR